MRIQGGTDTGASPMSACPPQTLTDRGTRASVDPAEARKPTTPEHGRSPRAGGEAGAAEPTPLVHREQSFTLSGDEDRQERYRRRSAGAEWMIRQSRVEAGMKPVADDILDLDTGELRRPRAGDVDWVRPPRVARCSWRIAQTVPVHADGSKSAHFSGTERCSSVWSCPVCASVIRAERSREIVKAVEQHQASGGAVVLLTLTARHRKPDALAVTLDGVMKSWQSLLRGKAWATFRERWKVAGYIRSVEVTYGSNGWHPHVHALLLLDKDVTEAQAQTMGDEIHGRWSRYVGKRTGRMPTRQRGVDVQRVDGNGKVLAQYIGKVQDTGKKWGVGAELARSDVKQGRGQSIVPFELLDRPVDEDGSDAWARRLWVEYVTATKGRRAITWSRGLKDRFELEELTDDEIIEDTESAPVRWIAYGPAYDSVRRRSPVLLARVLDAAEADDWITVEKILPGFSPEVDEDPPDG